MTVFPDVVSRAVPGNTGSAVEAAEANAFVQDNKLQNMENAVKAEKGIDAKADAKALSLMNPSASGKPSGKKALGAGNKP